ncbi:MAG: hypothetical protein Q9222_005696 [Ikaeria aurantiellina]
MNRTFNQIYGERQRYKSSDSAMQSLKTLGQDLADWSESTPLHLKFAPATVGKGDAVVPAPHTFMVILKFHVLQILLHRPFLSYGHIHVQLPNMALESFSACASAAESIGIYLACYERVHSFDRVPYFLLYAAFVSATIQVRIVAQRRTGTNAMAHLLTCLRVFDQNSKERSSALRAKSIIIELMTRTGLDTTSLNGSVHPGAGSPRFGNTATSSARQGSNTTMDLQQSQDNRTAGSQPASNVDWEMNDVDFDAVLQTFNNPPQDMGSTSTEQNAFVGPSADVSTEDPYDFTGHELYGFDAPEP